MDKKRILVLDDEGLILDLVSEFLKILDFQVETASSSQEAISKFKSYKDKGEGFQVVLFDMNLENDMDGKEVLEEVKKIDPNIKAIVSSGFSEDEIVQEPEKFGFDAAISKPYNLERLKEVLENLLD